MRVVIFGAVPQTPIFFERREEVPINVADRTEAPYEVMVATRNRPRTSMQIDAGMQAQWYHKPQAVLGVFLYA